MSKGSSPSGSTTTTVTPPSYAQPYIQTGLQNASNLLAKGPQSYYPGQQVASFNPLQEQSFSGVQSQANAPQNVTNAGNNYFTGLESGNYLNPASNPALQGIVQQSDQQIQNNLGSQFAGSGRNIEASAPVQASQMANVANQIYGGAYNNTLNNMTSALGQTGALNANQYLPSQMLNTAGNQVQNQAQNIIGGQMNQYAFNQQAPYNALNAYTAAVGGVPLGQQTSTPYFTNPTAGGLGGALLGNEIGSNIGSGYGGWGSAIGGLLGYMGSGG